MPRHPPVAIRRKRNGDVDLSPQDANLGIKSKAEKTESSRFLRRYLMRSLEVFLYWMPVWAPLILLAQIGTRGLREARSEDQRLRGHEEELQGRQHRDASELEALKTQLDALDDPIYLERLRRQRVQEQKIEIDDRGLAPLPPVEGSENRGRAE